MGLGCGLSASAPPDTVQGESETNQIFDATSLLPRHLGHFISRQFGTEIDIGIQANHGKVVCKTNKCDQLR